MKKFLTPFSGNWKLFFAAVAVLISSRAMAVECRTDASSTWPSCVKFQADYKGTGYIAFDAALKGQSLVGGMGIFMQGQPVIRYNSIAAIMAIKGDKLVLQFDDGSNDFSLGRLVGERILSDDRFSLSQELELATGIQISSSSIDKGETHSYYRNALNSCMEVISRLTLVTTVLTNGQRTVSPNTLEREIEAETPAPDQCHPANP